MKLWKKLCFINTINLVFLVSCSKNIKDDYPEESGCEKYAGIYDMYDPINQIHYDMSIDCSSGVIFGSTVWDSVHFSNFANLFSLGHGVGNGDLDGTIIQPLQDKYGNRWTFSNNTFPDYENKVNVLIKDSIYLYFEIENTAYWQEDGVPYQSITSVHSGVKIH